MADATDAAHSAGNVAAELCSPRSLPGRAAWGGSADGGGQLRGSASATGAADLPPGPVSGCRLCSAQPVEPSSAPVSPADRLIGPQA